MLDLREVFRRIRELEADTFAVPTRRETRPLITVTSCGMSACTGSCAIVQMPAPGLYFCTTASTQTQFLLLPETGRRRPTFRIGLTKVESAVIQGPELAPNCRSAIPMHRSGFQGEADPLLD